MGLHHATIGSAVKKYGPLHTEGKTEAEVRAAIAGDEKAFNPEQVDEIYAEIAKSEGEGDDEPKEPSPAKVKKAKGHIVAVEFRDKNDFSKLYKVGEDVSHFDEGRKADLVSRKLIEAI